MKKTKQNYITEQFQNSNRVIVETVIIITPHAHIHGHITSHHLYVREGLYGHVYVREGLYGHVYVREGLYGHVYVREGLYGHIYVREGLLSEIIRATSNALSLIQF
jgi:hypothetical protein